MNHERIRIVSSNTHFADLFSDELSMARLLNQDVPTIAGFSEVPKGRRELARKAIEASGYQVVFPDSTNLDLAYAIHPSLVVVATEAVPFTSRLQHMAYRGMGDRRRGIGVQGIVVATPTGRYLRITQQHLSPPVLEPFRRPQARRIRRTLRQQPYSSDDIVHINMGDNNHYPGPSSKDLQAYAAMGYYALLEPGAVTCDVHATNPPLARWLGRVGASASPQLDAAYIRPAAGQRLAALSDEPDTESAAQDIIRHRTELWEVASDHRAIVIDLHLPLAPDPALGSEPSKLQTNPAL